MYALAALVLAAGVSAIPQSPASSSRCYTDLTSLLPLVAPTSAWRTSYVPCTSTKTITTSTTITPAASTSTVSTTITTTTTAPTTTQTATKIDTSTFTTDTTVTSTSTSTVTTTTGVVSTSTIPAPAGFTPIQDSLPGSSYSGSARKRSEEEEEAVDKRDVLSYAASIACVAYTDALCVKTTATSTATIVATTPTVVTTTTFTQTNTLYPSATTTVTTSTTVTTTATSSTSTTVTSTSTITTVTGTATFYAQCAATNMADAVNGGGINDFRNRQGGAFIGSDVKADTAYDCCVAGLQAGFTDGLQVWAFKKAAAGGPYCQVVHLAKTCNAQSDNQWQADSGTGRYVIGNYGCSEFNAYR